MRGDLACFKAYDIRGRVPQQLNEDFARDIGLALGAELPRGDAGVAVGHDPRLSSPMLAEALEKGLRAAGRDVWRLGLCGTEEVYCAVFDRGLDGGVMITASHNPAEFNGMKIVIDDAKPMSADAGLPEIKRRLRDDDLPTAPTPGRGRELDGHRDAYVKRLLSMVDASALPSLKIVCDAGNGGAGLAVDALEPALPFELIKLRHAPDGRFPEGVPNPLLPENRAVTAAAVRETGADFGVAWDGDFDRCFLFDENGDFIEGYYLVGLLARRFLRRAPEAVVYDPRLVWNTLAAVEEVGGRAVQSRAGHAFFKQVMREEDAVYGGEMSAHHYFRDFGYCDSGMLPWLLIAEALAAEKRPLSALVREAQQRFPVSGEINRRVDEEPTAIYQRIARHYADQIQSREEVDGLSLFCGDWRCNVRASNTEPLLRLNVETRADAELLTRRTEELLGLIGGEA